MWLRVFIICSGGIKWSRIIKQCFSAMIVESNSASVLSGCFYLMDVFFSVLFPFKWICWHLVRSLDWNKNLDMTAFYSIYAPLLPVYRSFRIKPVVVRLSVILTICLWQAFGKTFARHLIVPSFRCYKSLKHPIIRCSFRNYFILLILFYFLFFE